jgi:hypothetical protein
VGRLLCLDKLDPQILSLTFAFMDVQFWLFFMF